MSVKVVRLADSFGEPIGSACDMPQGGFRKPPTRSVVMIFYFPLSGIKNINTKELTKSIMG